MDKPTNTITLGGMQFDLYFNLTASQELQEKYGDLKELAKKLEKISGAEQIDVFADLTAMLINGANEYNNYFRASDDQIKPMTARDVKALCSISESAHLEDAIVNTILGDSKQKIKSDPTEDSEKNLSDE